MEMKRRQPMGIELVRKGIVTEADIDNALKYQKEYPNKKIGDILNILSVSDPIVLLDAIGEILGEKTILLTNEDIHLQVEEYISLDVAKQNKAIPIEAGLRKD